MRSSNQIALILTKALTNGSFSLVSWNSFEYEQSVLFTASQLALHGAVSPWAQALSKAIHAPKDVSFSKPILLHNDKITGATYHHGIKHAHYGIGSLKAILRICNSTENERERAIQYARQQITMGNTCYGIAQGNSKNDVTSFRQLTGNDRLDFLGIVVVKPILYPNTLHRLGTINEKYDVIHYLTTGDEFYLSAVAIQAHLLKPAQEIIMNKTEISSQKSSVIYLSSEDYKLVLNNNKYDQVFNSQL